MPVVLGTSTRPLRVAIIGAGPSGFFAAHALFEKSEHVKVDMFDRLPSPYGLVRYGVAPDHEKMRAVIKVFDQIAGNQQFSFLGNVTIGTDLSVEELRKFYDAVIFACGAQSNRKLGIPGESLPGSYTAPEFVAWYNGHPDYVNRTFDLSHETAVIIGQGNVAMDVSRILCRSIDELKTTDIASYALDVLSTSKIRTVHVIGRRGPIQAAFSSAELREFLHFDTCDPIVNPKDLVLNMASQIEKDDRLNVTRYRNYEMLQKISEITPSKSRRVYFEFFRTPVEVAGKNRVEKILLEKTELTGEAGAQVARGTGVVKELPCGAIFWSVGYHGVPLEGVPFDPRKGVFTNKSGRITQSQQPVAGLYAVGWIKRGPSGMIGTNKADSDATVHELFEDIPTLTACPEPDTGALLQLLKKRGIRVISFQDWKKIDAAEVKRGQAKGKPREKFLNLQDMLKVIDK